MPTLQPQAALETALLNLMRAPTVSGGLAYAKLFCGRNFDGRPPPLARDRWYASVHSDGARQSGRNGAGTTALDATLGVWVTVTVELVKPFDFWVEHRDFCEAVVNAVVAMVHKDVYGNVVINAANVLAGRRRGDLPDNTHPVGFTRGLAWEGTDGIVEAGADWLNADPQAGRTCVYQRARFGGAILLQDPFDME